MSDQQYARERVAALLEEVGQLRAQRAAALARHTPDARMGHDDVRCVSCPEESWPCPTAQALEVVVDGADRTPNPEEGT